MAGNLGGSWTGSDWLAGGSLDAGEDCIEGPDDVACSRVPSCVRSCCLNGSCVEEVGPVEGVVGRV